MSARWFYEIDGREGGPISTVQLQLMANSGMLQPQHKIRKENSEQWSVAGDVRGLFAPTQPVGLSGWTSKDLHRGRYDVVDSIHTVDPRFSVQTFASRPVRN